MRNLMALLILACVIGSASGQSPRPNILFVFTDDHAPRALSAYGSKLISTPNMDRLANEGMLFENCLCTNGICAPSRAVILTGKMSHLNGVLTNAEVFDGSQETFPKLLRKSGYTTAMIGKWHLKSDPTGFDYYEVLRGQGPYYNPELRSAQGKKTYTGYTTDILTDLALDWLKKGRDHKKPFCLMYQHKAPHRNWQPPLEYLHLYDDVTIPEPATLFDDYAGRGSAAKQQTMTIAHELTPFDLKLTFPNRLNKTQRAAWENAYGPKNAKFHEAKLKGKDLVRWKFQRYMKDYLRCVASVDKNLGRVLAHLDATGLAKNTIVIYASDQGWYLGEHGWFDKRWMYEESLRMPLLVRWPGVTKAGSRADQMVSNLDFAPTFCEAAGVPIPEDMQGRSMAPILRGQKPKGWRSSFYYQYYEYPGVHDVRRHYGVRTERYKLIHFYRLGEWEFYDLKIDPDELLSRHADPSYKSIIDRLRKELTRLRRTLRVPVDTR